MILSAKQEELVNMEGIANFWVDMIMVSTILINLILCNTSIQHIYYSSYAVREGILYELVKAKPIA